MNKFKPNKYTKSRRDIIRRVDVDKEKVYYLKHLIKKDEDKKEIIK